MIADKRIYSVNFQALKTIEPAVPILYKKGNNELSLNIYRATGNCQTSIIAFANHLCSGVGFKENLINLLQNKVADIPQLLFDVRIDNSSYNEIEESFKNHIIIKSPYTNYNGNSMCLFLVSTKAIEFW